MHKHQFFVIVYLHYIYVTFSSPLKLVVPTTANANASAFLVFFMFFFNSFLFFMIAYHIWQHISTKNNIDIKKIIICNILCDIV